VLFTGEYEHTIDAKHRLAVPADIRSRLESQGVAGVFYLAPGSNGAIWLWPEETFEAMAGALERTLLPEEDLMAYEELLFSQASRVELDSTGRIRLPERMLQERQLGKQVVILGIRDHLEIRNLKEWKKIRQQKLEQQSEIILRARRALAEQHRQGEKDRP